MKLKRRTLLGGLLATLAACSVVMRAPQPAEAASASIGTWAWFPLPGSGLEVCLTEQRDPRKVAVTWTAAGAVTAFGATVTAGPDPVTAIIGTRSLSVRRILT